MADLEENSFNTDNNEVDSKMDATASYYEGQASLPVDKDFTTEIFKIEIGNLPKVYSVCHLKKFLIKLKLQPKKVRMVPRRNFAFVTFKCDEDRELAIKTLENCEWRNKILTVKMAKAKEDPFQKKKVLDENAETKHSNERQDDDQLHVNSIKGIRDVVTPLWNVFYEDQQSIKYKAMCEVLKKLGKELKAANVGKWIGQNRSQNSGMCCPLEKMLPSPVCESYRNKCEFTIGPGLDDKAKTVGFRLAAYKEGCSAVVEPSECTHISQAMKDMTQEFQCYIRDSVLDVFDPSTNDGFWKQLTVRSNLNNDVMCIVQISPSQNMCESDVESEIEKITTHFRDQNKIKLTSLYVEILPARKTEGSTSGNILRHVLGDQFIFETLCGLTFRISPLAFFQVNTKSAEILYKAIHDWTDVSASTIILDVCCGTGTIGLSMAKNVKRVIGIELCQDAVEDARFNAKSNGISNVEFHCGKAEDVIVKTTMALDEDEFEVVAILDPPRAGCHAKVLQAVRRCSKINKLIYVSCSPNSVLKDFIALCRPVSKRTKGDAFQIVKALPVDLFPQTRYCELVVLLERSL